MTSSELESVLGSLHTKVLEDTEDFDVDSTLVKSIFRRLHVNKAAGVDGICGRLLKPCAEQLCKVFSALFSWSLKDCCVPRLWTNQSSALFQKTKSLFL